MAHAETPDATGITRETDLLEIGEKMYRNTVEHACPVRYPFSSKNLCMHKGCNRPVTKRIIFKNVEIVHEYDVCAHHEELHQSSGIFPMKLGYNN